MNIIRYLVAIVALLTTSCVVMPMRPVPAPVAPELGDGFVVRTLVLTETLPDGTRAIAPAIVAMHFENAERIFAPIGLTFERTEIEVPARLTATSWDLLEQSAAHGNEVFVVWYVFPTRTNEDSLRTTVGSAAFPWMPLAGVCIFAGIADDWTLAHEIGHWLGLYHVFDGDDGVDDTPLTILGGTYNLMDYADGEPVVTDGQLDRMRQFLHTNVRRKTWRRPEAVDSTVDYDVHSRND